MSRLSRPSAQSSPKRKNDKAEEQLIRYAADRLRRYAVGHSDLQIRVEYPVTGEDGLAREVVEQLLASLPRNVTICY